MTFPTPVRSFACDQTCTEIAATPVVGADTLPSGNIVAPAVYTIFGSSVDMTTERLYRTADFNTRSAQVISYASDVSAFVRSLAWLTQDSDNDDGITVSTALSRSRTGTLGRTCGGVSAMAMSLLSQTNIPARETNGLTDSVLNAYDNGHTINEVWIGQWVAVDLDMKLRFYLDGVPLSTLGLHDAVFNNQTITFSNLIDGSVKTNSDFKYGWYVDWIRSNLASWYTRMFAMLQFPNGTGYDVMYENATQQAAIAAYGDSSFHPISRTDFLAKYYSKTHAGATANTTTGWGGLYTVYDRTTQLYPGAVVHSIGLNLANAHTGLKIKIGKENSSTNFDDAYEFSVNHPGGGMVDFVLPADFTIPATGFYRPGISGNLPSAPAEIFCSVGSRAVASGDVTGTGKTFSAASDGTICMRWTET